METDTENTWCINKGILPALLEKVAMEELETTLKEMKPNLVCHSEICVVESETEPDLEPVIGPKRRSTKESSKRVKVYSKEERGKAILRYLRKRRKIRRECMRRYKTRAQHHIRYKSRSDYAKKRPRYMGQFI
jgi:hypothetical protein